jgi:glycosyltransferase involved in cell wall biosynthesis
MCQGGVITTRSSTSCSPSRVGLDFTIVDRAQTGVAVYARELTHALGRQGLEPLCWRQPLGTSDTAIGKVRGALQLVVWLQRQLPLLIEKTGVEVYHSLTAFAPLRSPCTRVMTLHDTWLVTDRSFNTLGARLFYRVFSIQAARRAHAVIVPTRATAANVLRTYRIEPERLGVVPEGVSAAYHPRAPAETSPVLMRLGIRPPYVLFVGAQVPRKNLASLVRAFSQLVERSHFSGQLVLAGPAGPVTPSLRRLVGRLGLGDRVSFTGWVAAADLPAVYSAAACLAYPSLEEGFGLPILEAMACGAPVLTSDRSSMREVAQGAALLVDPLTPAAIAEGLRRLVTDLALARELTERGLEHARAYRWEETACRTLAVYQAAIARTTAFPSSKDGPSLPRS